MNSSDLLTIRMVACLAGAVLFPLAALHLYHVQPQHTLAAVTAETLIAMYGPALIIQFFYLRRHR